MSKRVAGNVGNTKARNGRVRIGWMRLRKRRAKDRMLRMKAEIEANRIASMTWWQRAKRWWRRLFASPSPARTAAKH